MSTENRIKALIEAARQKTGWDFNDLTEAVRELCAGYQGAAGASSAVNATAFQSGERLRALLSLINTVTGVNHADLTEAVQALVDGYEATPSTLLYSFGALSDTHIQYGGVEADGDYNGVNDFERALAYLDDKVDFICICGDLVAWADDAYMAEYKSIVTDDTLTDKPIYECTGNHETYPALGVGGTADKSEWDTTIGWTDKYASGGCNGESLYYSFTHGDDVFIMLSLLTVEGGVQFADGALPWLWDLLEANRNKRCFVFQHVHDKNDGAADPSHKYSNMLSSTQGAQFLALMRHYKNAVWFHGHTHLSVATGLDENGYRTDHAGYTPISTGLGYKSVHIPSLQGVRYYHPSINSLVNAYKYYGTDGNTYEAQGGQHAEGYIVDVYNNKIVIRTIDFALQKYTADWEAYFDVEPIEGKEFALNTRLQPVEADTFDEALLSS